MTVRDYGHRKETAYNGDFSGAIRFAIRSNNQRSIKRKKKIRYKVKDSIVPRRRNSIVIAEFF